MRKYVNKEINVKCLRLPGTSKLDEYRNPSYFFLKKSGVPGQRACMGKTDLLAFSAQIHFAKKARRSLKVKFYLGFDDSKTAIENDLTSFSFLFSKISFNLFFVLNNAQGILGHDT